MAAQIQGELAVGAAGHESQGLNQIALSDEQLKQTNYWNAIQALAGQAQLLDPTAYAGQTTGAANFTANLGEAFKQSQQSQLLGALGGIAGGVGLALGGYLGKH